MNGPHEGNIKNIFFCYQLVNLKWENKYFFWALFNFFPEYSRLFARRYIRIIERVLRFHQNENKNPLI